MSKPSRVIHVLNVGHQISENDLLVLFQPFGVITKQLMLRTGNQALVQMQDVGQAVNALEFFKNVHPNIRGVKVSVQFSSHQDLRTAYQNAHAGGNEDQVRPPLIPSSRPPRPRTQARQAADPHGKAELASASYECAHPDSPEPIEDDVIRQQEQRRERLAARFMAMQELVPNCCNGRNVFFECALQDPQFSKLIELEIMGKSKPTWDFSEPYPSAKPKGKSSQSDNVNAGSKCSQQAAGPAVAVAQRPKHDAIAMAIGGLLPPGVSGRNSRCIVLASNLNSDRIDEDKLFNLFSLYGNIVRIKFLHSKPDQALLQMGDGLQAELAVTFLKGAMLFGKVLDVNFTKHPNITPGPKVRCYSDSKLNYFKQNKAENYRNCCSPTKMLHLSSLPQDLTEEEIVSHLVEHGTIMSTKLFETNGKRQGLVLFETEEQATEALVCKHGTSFAGSVIRVSFSQSPSL